MNKSLVSIVKYEKPLESVKRAVELSEGFSELSPDHKVFIKPNIVYWNKNCEFPKWGVITTSRVVEDIIILLKEHGVKDITIGEGIVTLDFKDKETPKDAFERLGYNILKEKYGINVINTFDRPFEKVDLGLDFKVNINADALHSDFLVNLPVLKTHSQAVVSLGIKNLKGLINIASRKKFHGPDPQKNLHFNISKLPVKFPRIFTLIDGIYTLERGPAIDGKSHRKNILVASKDIFAADLVGARLLGFDPKDVPHLVHAAKDRNRPLDLSDVEVVGEKIEDLASHHEWDFIYNEAGDLPLPFEKQGIKGIKYRKYDTTLCTYCSGLTGILLLAIKYAWKGKPFDNVEFLTGKVMEPSPGMNKTVLVGQCMINKNKDHPNINELITIPGCPPSIENIAEAFKKCGIKVPSAFFKNVDKGAALFLKKYEGKPEFEESFFKIS